MHVLQLTASRAKKGTHNPTDDRADEYASSDSHPDNFTSSQQDDSNTCDSAGSAHTNQSCLHLGMTKSGTWPFNGWSSVNEMVYCLLDTMQETEPRIDIGVKMRMASTAWARKQFGIAVKLLAVKQQASQLESSASCLPRRKQTRESSKLPSHICLHCMCEYLKQCYVTITLFAFSYLHCLVPHSGLP